MGMDVYGKKPSSPEGDYFRNNVWWWHPLWEYCCHVAPSIAGKVKNGHSNDGDGLGKRDSLRLAKILREEVESGRTQKFKEERDEEIARLPKSQCRICGGTGKRDDQYVKGECNACKGKGWEEPWSSHYPFSTENVEEFAKFLEHCGGFRIC